MKQNAYEMFLDRLDPTWRSDQLTFFRVLAERGREAVPDLAERVHRASCAPDFRRLVLEASYYHLWKEWVPVVGRVLRHEKDPRAFETGARALGRLGSEEALGALKELTQSRTTDPYQRILDRVLREFDPAGAFHHHYGRLLQGTAHAAEANDGAHQLEKLLAPEHLEPLKALASHPDVLVFRHGLRLLGHLATTEAAEYLVELLREAREDALAERDIRNRLTAFRALPRTEVRDQVAQALAQGWEPRNVAISADLASLEPERLALACGHLRAETLSSQDTFLVDTLEAALDEKPAFLARHLTQAGEQSAQRMRRLEFALDATAQGLAEAVADGRLAPDAVAPLFTALLQNGLGRPPIATALARQIHPDDAEHLDLLLKDPDGALRMAAVDALGARRDPALREALTRLRRDPIADVAQRALAHLGSLPDPEGQARTWLALGDPEEIQVALRFILQHRLEGLVPDLATLVAGEPQEPVLLAALQTLGGLGSIQCAEPLFALLHSGQPLKLQVALAQALRDLGDPDVAQALCERALEFPSPDLCAVAVEALARAHAAEETPLPAAYGGLLIKLVGHAWNGRNPWPLRRSVAEALLALHTASRPTWSALSDLVQETLAEKRNPGSVASDYLTLLATCARALAKRAHP